MGFEEVYDYLAGKQDWLARKLPIEGEKTDTPTVGDVVRSDAVTCGLRERVGDVQERVIASPYGFALVVTDDGCLHGRLRGSELARCDPDSQAQDLMEVGPSTVRPGAELAPLVDRLRHRDLLFAVVTTPQGALVGVMRRLDAEQHLSRRPIA